MIYQEKFSIWKVESLGYLIIMRICAPVGILLVFCLNYSSAPTESDFRFLFSIYWLAGVNNPVGSATNYVMTIKWTTLTISTLFLCSFECSKQILTNTQTNWTQQTFNATNASPETIQWIQETPQWRYIAFCFNFFHSFYHTAVSS